MLNTFFTNLQKNLASPIILIALALTLVPTIFLPLGIDQSIFARGGEVLFGQGKLYIDYLELKPPLLFLFYGISGKLFGNSDISYRFFDFLWQLFTVYSLLYCVQRSTRNRTDGIIAAGVYAVLYSSMGHSETMECESFIAPAVVWLLYFSAKSNSTDWKITLVKGGLAGFIFGLKFTFGLAFATLLLWEIVEENKGLIRKFAFLTIGFIIASVCSFWIIFNSEVLHRYLDLLEYNRAYAGNVTLGIETLRTILMQLGYFFGDNISLVVTVAAAFGVGISLKRYFSDSKNETGRLVRISTFVFIALLLSVIIERKFNPYHFLRIYVPLSVLAALGFSGVLGLVTQRWKSFPFSWRVIFGILCCCGLIMSPIPRCLKNIRPMYLYLTSTEKYWATFQKDSDPALIMVDARNIKTFIRSTPKGGKIFAIATAASYLYRELNEHPISKFSMPMFYYATIIPEGAYEGMRDEVQKSQWLIIQKNDFHPVLFGHSKSSWECVRQDSSMFKYLNQHFKQQAEIGAFYIFVRN